MKVNATQLETRRPTALKFSVDLSLEYFDADYGEIGPKAWKLLRLVVNVLRVLDKLNIDFGVVGKTV